MNDKKKRKQKLVYKNNWTSVYEDTLDFPDGKSGLYGFVERDHGAIILVVDSSNKVLLLK